VKAVTASDSGFECESWEIDSYSLATIVESYTWQHLHHSSYSSRVVDEFEGVIATESIVA
jgi:hypothetical protein